VGKVNGTGINRVDFDKKVQEFIKQYGEDSRAQIINGVWDQEVSDLLVNEQAEKLGLTVTEKEMRDVLYGNNPPQFLAKVFTDPNTGKFDGITAQQQVNQILKKGAPGQAEYDYITTNIEQVKSQRLVSKYMTLLTNTLYFPKWFLEKRNADNSLMGRISYIAIPYGSIPDSTVQVSDDEIKSYMKDHRDEFEQKEETRAFEYVLFNAAPTAADSAATVAELEKLRAQFSSTNDPGNFLAQQNSTIQYDNTFHGKSTIQVPAKDSIFATPAGDIYGPYLDASNYVMAKVIEVKNLPDSVKCRHILLGTVDPQTGQPIMADSVAKAKADSVALAIKNGASFDLLDSLYSTDQAAKAEKGVMTFSSADIQGPNFAKEFGQFILFDGKPGDKKVVKTQFGWHYIEILDHKNVQPYYKVAYLAREIFPSDETVQAAQNASNLFAGDSRDLKSFNDNYEKKLRPQGINKLVAADVHPLDFSLNGVGDGTARSFIKKVFEAKKGEVMTPEKVGQNFVVAVVTEINDPGLPGVASVRPRIEPILRNKKKEAIIIKNIGKITTLEEASAKTKQPIQVADSIRFGGGQVLGRETRVLGAAFNPSNKGKVIPEALAGSFAVFVVRVDNTTTVPVEAANVDDQRKMLENQTKQQLMQQLQSGYNPIIEPLKNAASIKDKRAEFY
jgi:peptidyl-prolyl cis-trans isomerase D